MDEYYIDPESEEFIDFLIEEGILEEDGFDQNGDVTYVYNFELMKVMLPDMYDEIMSDVNENLLSLYEKGLIKIEYDEDLKAHFSATDLGKRYFRVYPGFHDE